VNVTVVDLKPKHHKRASRGLPLEQATETARFFGRMVREIESDLGGRRRLSRIEVELVHAFSGAATILSYLNRQIILGEASEIDLGGFATLASTMLRIGAKLGLSSRRVRDVTPDFYKEVLPRLAEQQEMPQEEAQQEGNEVDDDPV
jgi:hypothetical protein